MTLEIWLELSGQSKTFQNDFKTNPGKFHFLLGPFVDRPIKIIGPTIKASRQEVLLGIRIDSDRTFKEDITSIYSKANKKFHIHEQFMYVKKVFLHTLTAKSTVFI